MVVKMLFLANTERLSRVLRFRPLLYNSNIVEICFKNPNPYINLYFKTLHWYRDNPTYNSY
jgi:hypothetical protein